MRRSIALFAAHLFLFGLTGLAASTLADDAGSPSAQSLEALQSRLGAKALTQPWSGDLDGMIERRVIRVLTVYGLGRYFLEGPVQKGTVYEMFKAFETELNKQRKTGAIRVHVVFIPVRRDQLFAGLIEGRGDIAAAGLTITSTRQELVDFSIPVSKEIHEILVTGPSAPEINSLEGLAGQTVHVRESSSYYSSLQQLSDRLEDAGHAAIDIQPISELLEDDDLLEMVQGGLLPWVVVDDYKAHTWSKVFNKLVPRPDLVLRSGGRVGYAFRKDSPQLAAALNQFLQTHKAGTLFGNVLLNRNYRDFDWVANATAPTEMQRFREVEDIFRKYGEQYGFDYLMIAAQGFQESRFDQKLRSKAGAVGIMQLLPSTAADPNVDIPDINSAGPNIHAGIKYLNFIRTRYFEDLESDRFNQTLLAIAAYNAGPTRVQGLRADAEKEGLDPNVWFGNVEIMAAREIGTETVQYVANIYKYYLSYRMSLAQASVRASEREAQGLEAEQRKQRQR